MFPRIDASSSITALDPLPWYTGGGRGWGSVPLHAARRRGVTSVVAMLYMVLFSTLAVGAYSAVTTAVQVSYNERNVNAARAAAESGMEFIRYQLFELNIPHSTNPSALFSTVETQLASALNNTANLGSYTVGYANNVISIPGTSGAWIANTPDGSEFSISITPGSGTQLVVKVTGQGPNSTVQRNIQMNFDIAQEASAVFNYGVATAGTLSMAGNSKIQGATDPTKGSVLSTNSSAHPLSMAGNSKISGDVSFVTSNGWPSIVGSPTIDGYTQASGSFSSHVHDNVPSPQFPTIDTSAFAQYATSPYVASSKTLSNVTLPSGTYTFSGNYTIKGVLLIQAPANITFSGNTTIQGAIVVQNNPTGNDTTNVINFNGNVSASSISTLPDRSYPAGELTLTNSFVLAPDFTVNFAGNFGTVAGSIIADGVNFTGNANGTVDGTVIGLANLPMNMSGNGTVTIASAGTTQYPTGVFFGQNYVPLADTYQEVLP